MMTRSRKRKPTKKICGYTLPNPPKGATHVVLACDDKKKAIVSIKDFDTLDGSAGFFHYIKRNPNGKLLEKWPDTWRWTGKEVVWEFDM